MSLGVLVVIVVAAVFIPVGIITYLVVIPRLRGPKRTERESDSN
jgi:hypothetical protein